MRLLRGTCGLVFLAASGLGCPDPGGDSGEDVTDTMVAPDAPAPYVDAASGGDAEVASGCDPAEAPEKCACADDAPCAVFDDADACNGSMFCGPAGYCAIDPDTIVVCDDGDPCTDEMCLPDDGSCVASHNVAPCDDGNPCTADDACAEGVCSPGAPVPECVCEEAAHCAVLEDGDRCNGTLVCDGGACVVDPLTVVACDDPDDACVVAACAPEDGTCVEAPADEGVGCDDSDACTTGDACDGAGACVGAAIDCTSQEDGDLCNGTLVCDGGVCVVAVDTVVVCDPSDDPCEVNRCAPSNGVCSLEPAPVGVSCDDGDACTTGDGCDGAGGCAGTPLDCSVEEDGDLCNGTLVCEGGACVVDHDTAVVCDASIDPCYVNVCEAASGTCLPEPGDSGVACNDGDSCTVDDVCDGAGGCAGGPMDCSGTEDGDRCNGTLTCQFGVCAIDPATVVVCGPSGDLCQASACDPAEGVCVLEPADAGTGCDDDDSCTIADVCDGSGQCAGTAKTCPDDSNPCTDAACSSADGLCETTFNDGACEDGDACTGGDTCSGGVCESGAPIPDCGCNTAADCEVYEDGNPCNGTLTCTDGSCVVDAATVVTCEAPADPCLVNVCDSGDGTCALAPVGVGTECDDGDLCTTEDICGAAGACAGVPVACAGQEDGDLCNGTLVCVGGACVVDADTVVTCEVSVDPCYVNACLAQAGTCSPVPADSGASCDDADPCTTDDVCDGGGACAGAAVDCSGEEDGDLCNGTLVCEGGACVVDADTVVTCDASADPCWVNACAPGDGTCGLSPADSGASCDDADPCTTDDVCDGGGACAGAAVDCSGEEDGDLCNGTLVCDGGNCVVDAGTVVDCGAPGGFECYTYDCNPDTGACFEDPLPSGADCDDFDECTEDDKCDGAKNCAGTPKACPDDAGQCEAYTCAGGTCTLGPASGPCDDGNPCTTGGTCSDGACLAGSPDPACVCTADAHCDALDDGNPCNGTLYCNLDSGACEVVGGSEITCGGATGPCAEEVCDPDNGECVTQLADDGTPCDDGDNCTEGDTCDEGACVASPKVCPDTGDPCTVSTCESGDGLCVVTDADGACDDGNPCTAGDSCSGGSCQSGAPDDSCTCNDHEDCAVLDGLFGDLCEGTHHCTLDGDCEIAPGTGVVCPPNETCALWACDPGSGECLFDLEGEGTPCDDENPCTELDVCDGTQECGGTVVECADDDGDPCTVEACDEGSGDCVTSPKCDDGDACTADACDVDGGCGHADVACDDANPCTSEACDPLVGCEYEPIDGSCDLTGACIDAMCGAVEPSPKSCSQLGLGAGQGVDTVCGASQPGGVECSGFGTRADAEAFCSAADMRLCTLSEVANREVAGTGCSYDAEPVWTQTPCGEGRFWTLRGNSEAAPICRPQADHTAVARCCADADTADPARSCIASEPVDCDDGLTCTTDSCDPVQGCSNDPVGCEDNDPCQDSACTEGETTCPFTTVMGGSCYEGVELVSPQDFGFALGYCSNNGGHLVTISSAAENALVAGLLVSACAGSSYAAIGFSDEFEPGTFSWLGAEPRLYENWAEGQPDNAGGGEHYAMLLVDGTWSDTDGEGVSCFVCEASFEPVCAGTPVDCSDGDLCTEDQCSPTQGCANPAVDCDDSDACTDDSCDPNTGDCEHVDVECDDGESCTIQQCDPASGCQTTIIHEACCSPQLLVAGCEQNPGCHACVCAMQPDCCGLGASLGWGAECADLASGPCALECGCDMVPADCDDNACTTGSECNAGVCEPGDPVVCEQDDKDCTIALCDPATGTCGNSTNLYDLGATGTCCYDADSSGGCPGNQACHDCVVSKDPFCANQWDHHCSQCARGGDGHQGKCLDGECGAVCGCFIPCENDKNCSVGFCDGGAACQDGAPACNDGDDCTVDSCDEVNGCAADPLQTCPGPAVMVEPGDFFAPDWVLVGAATFGGGGVNLTPDAEWSEGAAWWTEKVPAASGFTATMRLKITSSQGNVGDGFAFVVQNVGTAAEGNHTGLGGGDLAITFDNYANNFAQSGDDIVVFVDGAEIDRQPVGYDLTGTAFRLAINYDGDALKVWVNGDLVTSLTGVTIAGTSIVDDNGSAWVGVIGGSTAAYARHRLEAFQYQIHCAGLPYGVCPPPVSVVSGDFLASNWYLVEDASISSGGASIVLTPDATWSSGDAWWKSKVPARDGFTARIACELTPSQADTGDGIAFVVQNVSPHADGIHTGLGGSDLTVAVDTRQNNASQSGNDAVVYLDGEQLAIAPVGYELSDAPFVIDVSYDGDALTVSVDGVQLIALAGIDLSATDIVDVNGYAWIGVIGRTAVSYEQHAVTGLRYVPACQGAACNDGCASGQCAFELKSAWTCGQLGWDTSAGPDDEVCGESNVPGCYEMGFEAAEAQCASLHARLCTLEETLAGEATGTGCGFNSYRIWTSDRCAGGGAYSAAGQPASQADIPTECSAPNTLNAVRCCGDTGAAAKSMTCVAETSGTCQDGEACTIDSCVPGTGCVSHDATYCEDPATLPEESCCGGTATPFCGDASCVACVCELDPYCCIVAWDGQCALKARGSCWLNCAGCEPDP